LETQEGPFIGGEIGVQHLERHLALERCLLGKIDLSHAASAKSMQDTKLAEHLTGPIDFLAGDWGCRRRGFVFLASGLNRVVHRGGILYRPLAAWRSLRAPSIISCETVRGAGSGYRWCWRDRCKGRSRRWRKSRK